MTSCICGHSEKDHSLAERCHVVGCPCEHFEPIPEIAGSEEPHGGSPLVRGPRPSVPELGGKVAGDPAARHRGIHRVDPQVRRGTWLAPFPGAGRRRASGRNQWCQAHDGCPRRSSRNSAERSMRRGSSFCAWPGSPRRNSVPSESAKLGLPSRTPPERRSRGSSRGSTTASRRNFDAIDTALERLRARLRTVRDMPGRDPVERERGRGPRVTALIQHESGADPPQRR
jgi:hypothetical protein